jgi:ClpP class serine protease
MTPVKTASSSEERRTLIGHIEAERKSRVITYFLSDRRGAQAQVAEDAVRPMYDHLRSIGPTARLDLLLYSVGGLTDIPWRLVTMIRQFTKEFGVLVPYKALSAATMIAIGADEIVMGRKGELGPIDPQMAVQRGGEGGTVVQEQIAVEDIMSYLRFMKEKAGLSDQAALSGPVASLCDKLGPSVLGQANRAHSHIRSVARKLLTSHTKKPMLDEKTYQHGHAIGRSEAEEIGLPVADGSQKLDSLMWELYESYEEIAKLASPIDPHTFIPPGQDEHLEPVIMGCIESMDMAHHFEADLKGRRTRQMPPQLALNLNFNLQLPANVNLQQIPAAAQQAIQQLLQQLQQQAQPLIQKEIQAQMPIVGFEGWLQDAAWRRLPDWSKASA